MLSRRKSSGDPPETLHGRSPDFLAKSHAGPHNMWSKKKARSVQSHGLYKKVSFLALIQPVGQLVVRLKDSLKVPPFCQTKIVLNTVLKLIFWSILAFKNQNFKRLFGFSGVRFFEGTSENVLHIHCITMYYA